MLGIEDRKALQQFSRVRDVDVAVEIGKGIIDAGALAAGLVLTGPAGVIAGLGIETLAIGLCVEHGDDEEAIARTVGVIAGVGLGTVSKYADDVVDLTDVKQPKNMDVVEEITDNLDDVVEGGSGSITYGELDSLGRTTGIETTITPDMIGTGSPAK